MYGLLPSRPKAGQAETFGGRPSSPSFVQRNFGGVVVGEATVHVSASRRRSCYANFPEQQRRGTCCPSCLPYLALANWGSLTGVGPEDTGWPFNMHAGYCDNKGRTNAVSDFFHYRIFIPDFRSNNTSKLFLQNVVVETAAIIAFRNDSFSNSVHFEHILRELDIHLDALLNGLELKGFRRSSTIRNRPSIIAIIPPVLVPPIISKYSQGKGAGVLLRLPISSIICRNINSDDKPLTPPPSIDRMRG